MAELDLMDALKHALEHRDKLLVIELDDESSVPKVFYKGEEVKYKVSVQFDWDTEDALSQGGLTYAIENVEMNQDKVAVANRIERRTKDHK